LHFDSTASAVISCKFKTQAYLTSRASFYFILILWTNNTPPHMC